MRCVKPPRDTAKRTREGTVRWRWNGLVAGNKAYKPQYAVRAKAKQHALRWGCQPAIAGNGYWEVCPNASYANASRQAEIVKCSFVVQRRQRRPQTCPAHKPKPKQENRLLKCRRCAVVAVRSQRASFPAAAGMKGV